jgi:GxxExxY protein
LNELLCKDEVYRVMGAAMEVYKTLRNGVAEAVYREALEIEFGDAGIPFTRQVPLRIKYKGRTLEKRFFADLICFGSVLVELKAISQTTKADESQMLNYMRATGIRVGLLINFGAEGRLEWHRFVI